MMNILIGIQARSTSTRFPEKCFALLDGIATIEYVIDAAHNSASYLNKYKDKNGFKVHVALLVPTGDKLVAAYKDHVDIVEGDEADVLSRYVDAAAIYDASYIVRLTGDCPLIPAFLISKMIHIATKNDFDYVANCDPLLCTMPDGHDCEVFSRDMLEHIDSVAFVEAHREHVTLLMRDYHTLPEWAHVGAVIGFLDMTDQKLSIDTKEDLELVEAHIKAIKARVRLADTLLGRQCIHRF